MTARVNTTFHPANVISRLENAVERQALWLQFGSKNRVAAAGTYLAIEHADVAAALGYKTPQSIELTVETKSAVLMMAEFFGEDYVAEMLQKHPKTFATTAVRMYRKWGAAAMVDATAVADQELLIQDYLLEATSVCYQWDNTRIGAFDETAWNERANTLLEELALPQVTELRIRDAMRNYCEAARPIEETAEA